MLDHIEYLADILTFADMEVRIKAVDMLNRDGTINRLEERMKRMKKEAVHYGEEREIA